MAEIKNGLLLENSRVFIPSANINIFPCSRRGPYSDSSMNHYDPEARLNTERTNRLRTAINGFKNSFIVSFIKDKDEETKADKETGTLTFALAGYYAEVKSFSPTTVATTLGTDSTIYAHLRLHTGIHLDVERYFTEILARQSSVTTHDKNYLDVLYTYSPTDGDGEETTIQDDFFVGISFTKEPINESGTVAYNLPLFSYSTDSQSWELVQTSLLPRVEHGETVDSIKVSGDFAVKHGSEAEFKVAADEDGYWGAKFTVPVTVETDLVVTGLTTAPTLDVDTILNDNDKGITITKSTSYEGEPTRTLKVVGKTATDTLVIQDTNPETNPNEAAYYASVTNESADFNVPVTIGNDLAINENYGIATNTIEVDEIKSRSTGENAKVVITSPVSMSAGLSITDGDTELGATTVSSLTVATDKVTVTSTAANFNVPVTVESSLESTGSVKTPTLDVQTIKNTATDATTGDNLGVSIDDALSVTGATSVNNTITAKKLIIPSNIGEDSKEKGEVTTPKLRVDTITSNSDSILVDDKKLLVTKSLEVLAKNAIDEDDQEKPAMATIDKAVIGELIVQKDDTTLTGSTGNITAKEVAADKITQNGKPVPAIALAQINSSNTYQLQITLNAAKPKEN